MTAKEILEKIEATELPVDVFAHDEAEYAENHYRYDPETGEETEWTPEEAEKILRNLEEELGGWEEVSQKGGEGQGDEWYSVKYFPAHDVYIRTDGWYTSYHGTDFEDGYGKEVRPTERVVTFYE